MEPWASRTARLAKFSAAIRFIVSFCRLASSLRNREISVSCLALSVNPVSPGNLENDTILSNQGQQPCLLAKISMPVYTLASLFGGGRISEFAYRQNRF